MVKSPSWFKGKGKAPAAPGILLPGCILFQISNRVGSQASQCVADAVPKGSLGDVESK